MKMAVTWLAMLAASAVAIATVAAAIPSPYGAEPWLSGNPVAAASQVVSSSSGLARFTVLTQNLGVSGPLASRLRAAEQHFSGSSTAIVIERLAVV